MSSNQEIRVESNKLMQYSSSLLLVTRENEEMIIQQCNKLAVGKLFQNHKEIAGRYFLYLRSEY